MRRLDLLWSEFVYGGHWLSIGASAVSLSAMVLFNVLTRWEFLFIVYLGTQCIYNYNHYKELEIDAISNSPRANHLKKNHNYLPQLTILYGLGFIIMLVLFGNRNSIVFGTLLLSLGILFTVKVKKFSKKLVGFKTIYTGLCWGLLVFFTGLYTSTPLDSITIMFSLFVFIRWIMNVSFFDIKDLQSDKHEGLLTFSIVLDKYNLIFIQFLNVLSSLPILLGVFFHILPFYSLFLLFILIYGAYYIQKAKNPTADINSLSYILADGEYYYWPFLLFIGLSFMSF